MRPPRSSSKANKADREIPPNARREDLLPDEHVARGTEAEQAAAIRAAAAETAPVVTDDAPGATEGPAAPEEVVQEIVQVFEDDVKLVVGFEGFYDSLGLSRDMSTGHRELQERFVDLDIRANFYTRKLQIYGTDEQLKAAVEAIPELGRWLQIR